MKSEPHRNADFKKTLGVLLWDCLEIFGQIKNVRIRVVPTAVITM